MGISTPIERGDTVLVSDNLAFRVGLGVGDRVVLASPTARTRSWSARIIQDYTIDAGTVTVETETYRRLWRDAQVSVFLVHLAPGRRPPPCARASPSASSAGHR